MKSNYDKLSQALSAWYTPDQIEKIWALLKKFDQTLKPSSSQAGGPSHKESGLKRLKKVAKIYEDQKILEEHFKKV